jgi:hypothetical protein
VVCGCQALTRAFCPPHLLAEPRELLQSVVAGLTELKIGQAELKIGQAELTIGQAELATKVGKLEGDINLAAYKATHTLSPASLKAVNEGALFFITDGEGGKPLFCGFFTSSTIALTINHDVMFAADPLPLVHAVSSAGRPLIFDAVSTSTDLDFTVLKLRAPCTPSTAFFSLPGIVSVERDTPLGLVSMGLGFCIAHGKKPHIMQHRVSVASCDDESLLYDGPTWSGAALLLFDESFVVGEKGEPHVSPFPKKRRVTSCELDRLHTAASVVSSHGKVCRALLLSHATVRAAVEAAAAPVLVAGGV